MENLFLEDILEQLAEYGLPTLHRYGAKGSRDFTKGGAWNCAVRIRKVPHDLDPYPCPYRNREDKLRDPISFSGSGQTPREAARQCLERMQTYRESGWHHLWPEELHPSRREKKPLRVREKILTKDL